MNIGSKTNPPKGRAFAVMCGVATLLSLTVTDRAYGQEEEHDRFAEVYAQRVELQSSMRIWLEQALGRIAYPYELMVTVRLQMRGQLHELTNKEVQPGMEMSFGGKKTAKLPGLPKASLPDGGPVVSFKVPAYERVAMQRRIEALVEQVSVRLHIDEDIPEAQLEEVKQATVDLAALDFDRGDVLEVIKVASSAGSGKDGTAVILAQRSVWTLSATFLIATVIMAWALTRRQKAAAASAPTGGAGAGAAIPGLGMAGAAGQAGVGLEGKGSNGSGDGLPSTVVTKPPRAFAALLEVDQEQLVETLGNVDTAAAAAVLDQLALPADVQRKLFERLTEARRLELVRALAKSEVVPVAALEQMEQRVQEELARVQSRVAIGSSAKAADLLAAAPDDVVRSMMAQLADTDPELQARLRGQMVLFEDLARLAPDGVRRVVAALDPGLIALALHGAEPGVRDAINNAVSSRLARILAVEAETLGDKSDDEVAAARQRVEAVLRHLRREGELTLDSTMG